MTTTPTQPVTTRPAPTPPAATSPRRSSPGTGGHDTTAGATAAQPSGRLTAVAAVVGPVVMLASTIAFAANGAGMSEGEAPGAILVWSAIAYGVALVGLARSLDRSSARLAAAVTALGVAGACGTAAYGLDAIQQAVLAGDVYSSPAVPIALRIPGLLFPLALLVLGVAVARSTGSAGRDRLAAWALVAGAVLFPVGRIADLAPVALATDVLLLAALPAVAATLRRPAGAR